MARVALVAMTAPEPSDPKQAPAGDAEIGTSGDPLVLAERRARRAELAEGQARERLADAEARVAQLEQAGRELTELRGRFAERARRDAELAGVVAQAAAATRSSGIAAEPIRESVRSTVSVRTFDAPVTVTVGAVPVSGSVWRPRRRFNGVKRQSSS